MDYIRRKIRRECILHPEKLRYKDEYSAWWGAYGVYKKYQSEMRPYACESCLEWHLTKNTTLQIPDWLVETLLK